MRAIITFTFIVVSSVALGDGTFHPENAKNAVFLDLEEKSFELVSQLVRDLYLPDMENEPLEDVSWDGPMGVTAEAKDLNYSVKFRSLRIEPGDKNILSVSTSVEDVILKAEEVVIDPPIFSPTVCNNTTIHIGKSRAVPVHLNIRLAVQDHELVVASDSVNFSLDKDDYESRGPEKCSGNALTRVVKQFLLSKLLGFARGVVESQIKKAIAKAVPGVGSVLNLLIKQELELALKDFPPLPEKTIFLGLLPGQISISKERLHLALDVAVSERSHKFFATSMVENAQLKYLLGKAGLNINLINELLSSVFGSGTDYVELTKDISPELDEILTRQHLAALWPDLNELRLDSESIRLFFKLAAAPHVYMGEGLSGNMELRFAIPALSVKSMIKRGHWHDYFFMDLIMDAATRMQVVNDFLEVGLGARNTYDLKGRWADDYLPQVDMFEVEIAEILINSVFDILYAASPIVRSKLPDIELYDQSMHLDRIDLANDYISTEVWAVSQ